MNENPNCIFCKIARKEFHAWPIWENEDFLAFLTPFPNTPGFTVVIPKSHTESDVMNLADEAFTALMLSAKSVSELLKHSLHVRRVGLVIEGMGVDHAHVKLIPMHGISDGEWKAVLSSIPTFSDAYQGFLSTNDGPRMSDEELSRIQQTIRAISVG
jgi:histidine triad (HIT) family protein